MSITQKLVTIENHRVQNKIVTDEINTNADMRITYDR